MAGELSGTKKFLAREDTPGAGTFTQVAGENTATLTANNTPVEITNKSAGDVATFLTEEGIKNATMSGEYTFNSDASFASVLGDYDSKAIIKYLYGDGTAGAEFDMIITNVTVTSNQGERVTAAVSWQITGAFNLADL